MRSKGDGMWDNGENRWIIIFDGDDGETSSGAVTIAPFTTDAMTTSNLSPIGPSSYRHREQDRNSAHAAHQIAGVQLTVTLVTVLRSTPLLLLLTPPPPTPSTNPKSAPMSAVNSRSSTAATTGSSASCAVSLRPTFTRL